MGLHSQEPEAIVIPAQLILLLGNKGSGKSLLQSVIAQISHQVHPEVPQVANVHIKHAVFYEDILKFFAIKLKQRDRTYVEGYVDEGAQSGLEARGQGSSEDMALKSYLFTLSRKANVNVWLASQLMSMLDKRIQWIGDWFILCEAKPDPINPEYFLYKVYDSYDNLRNKFTIDFKMAQKYIFNKTLYRTDEIPFEKSLMEAYTDMFEITEKDLTRFNRIIGAENA